MRSFRPEDRLSRYDEILSTELDQEVALMSIDAGAYYGLKGTARSIWEILETPVSFSDLVARLVEEYKVSPEDCAADVQEFLRQMEQEHLLRVE